MNTNKMKYKHTFTANLNSYKRKEEYNKQMQIILNAPVKAFVFDGVKFIEIN